MTDQPQPVEDWAIVELMGHLRRAGRISEVDRFGAKLLRVDIPAGEDFVTEFYGGSAIYRLRPCAEDITRAVAEQLGDPRPVKPVGLREGETRARLGYDGDLEGEEDDERTF